MAIVTRFAPSPTGYLHLGGARTALFNYVFAKSQGGRYLLRIEDTDKARSTSDAIKAIHDGLSWLGLEGDAPAVMQSEQEARHREVAEALLANGYAYRCYLSDAQLDALRQDAKAKGVALRSPWRDPAYEDKSGTQNSEFVIRLRMPDDGTLTISDLVQGDVSVAATQLDDMVLCRSDGSPTYMLAVVVDDHDMGITHIIRGDDHLNNAFRQMVIYQAMGWDIPAFAHIPLIHGQDGAKLSKRHGAVGIEAYRDEGYLPEAMINYLMRLGWSHGDEELFTMAQAISWFDITKVGKAPSRFDVDKLRSVNHHHLRQAAPDLLTDLILSKADKVPSPDATSRLLTLMPLLTERAMTTTELCQGQDYLIYDDAPNMTEEAAALLTDEAKAILQDFAGGLPETLDTLDVLKTHLNTFLEARGLKMKHIGLPLRAALTGTKQSPSITDIIVALGAKEVKRRIETICK